MNHTLPTSLSRTRAYVLVENEFIYTRCHLQSSIQYILVCDIYSIKAVVSYGFVETVIQVAVELVANHYNQTS